MIRWLCYKIVNMGRRYGEVEAGRDSLPVLIDDVNVDMERSLRFAILPARGGCVFEIRKRDLKTHECETITYVISEGADVAKEVGDIVAMELLRR